MKDPWKFISHDLLNIIYTLNILLGWVSIFGNITKSQGPKSRNFDTKDGTKIHASMTPHLHKVPIFQKPRSHSVSDTPRTSILVSVHAFKVALKSHAARERTYAAIGRRAASGCLWFA